MQQEDLDEDELEMVAATTAADLIPDGLDGPDADEAIDADRPIARKVTPWPLPPSLTRKRPRGKSFQPTSFDTATRPRADGFWYCDTCDACYETCTGLFGHVHFCEGRVTWQCEWCKCGAHETHHKAQGPNGPKTLCSACGQRYRTGHNGMPEQNEKGEWVCERCERGFLTISALGGHRRFCDGGVWRCSWCQCKAEDTQGRGRGPDGDISLCGACVARYRSGQTGPPVRNAEGKFLCEDCDRTFDTISGIGSHRNRCDGGNWRCAWCKCDFKQAKGRSVGPDGPATLCGPCAGRYRGGHTGPPTMDENGRFNCDNCTRTFETIAALGVHRRHCDGGNWKCAWCKCSHSQAKGRSVGPDGPATLCGPCSSRFRSGHTGPPAVNEEGRFTCDNCTRTFETIAALGVHRRRCDGGNWKCEWCEKTLGQTSGKGPGPNGAGTLCSSCSGRFRSGYDAHCLHRVRVRARRRALSAPRPTLLYRRYSVAPTRDAGGGFVCECGRIFETLSAMGNHRRWCLQGKGSQGVESSQGSEPGAPPATKDAAGGAAPPDPGQSLALDVEPLD